MDALQTVCDWCIIYHLGVLLPVAAFLLSCIVTLLPISLYFGISLWLSFSARYVLCYLFLFSFPVCLNSFTFAIEVYRVPLVHSVEVMTPDTFKKKWYPYKWDSFETGWLRKMFQPRGEPTGSRRRKQTPAPSHWWGRCSQEVLTQPWKEPGLCKSDRSFVSCCLLRHTALRTSRFGSCFSEFLSKERDQSRSVTIVSNCSRY